MATHAIINLNRLRCIREREGAQMHRKSSFLNLHIKHTLALIVLLFGLFITDSAFALLINIDFDQSIADRRPSDAFGAASGQAGIWNQVRLGNTSDLLDIQGNATPVDITVSAFSDAGQAFYPTNDTQRLLNDNLLSIVNTIPSVWSVTIADLQNTVYDLFLYAPTNLIVSTGPMKANGVLLPELLGNELGLLVEGESWISTEVEVTNGMLSITGTPDNGNRAFAGLAGLQLAAVPEPGTMILLGTGLIGLLGLRKLQKKRN